MEGDEITLRLRVLELANILGGFPKDVVERAETYLAFLTSESGSLQGSQRAPEQSPSEPQQSEPPVH